jgi:hypothetical protein
MVVAVPFVNMETFISREPEKRMFKTHSMYNKVAQNTMTIVRFYKYLFIIIDVK